MVRQITFAAFLIIILAVFASGDTWSDLFGQAELLRKSSQYDSAIIVGHQALLEAIDEFGQEDTAVASLYHLLGRCHSGKSEYETADSLLMKALTIRRKLLPSDHPDILQSMRIIAAVNGNLNKSDLAEQMYLQAINEFENVTTPVCDELYYVFNNLNRLYQGQNRYDEAIKILNKAIDVISKMCGQYSSGTINAMVQLSTVYTYVARYDDAVLLADQVLKLGEALSGRNDTLYAGVLHKIAYIYYFVERIPEAESLSLKSLALSESILGIDSKEVAGALHILANIYTRQGKFIQAMEANKRTLNIYEKTYAANNTLIANQCYNMSLFFDDLGRVNDSEMFIRRALKIWQKTLGVKHADYAAGIRQLADIYSEMGLYAKAEPLYVQAFNTMAEALGPEHDEVALILYRMGLLYSSLGIYDKAEEYHRKALLINEKYSRKHPIANSMRFLAEILTKQGRYVEAESYYIKANVILKELYGPDGLQYAYGLQNLGWCYLNQNKYFEAEDLEIKALEIFANTFDASHIDYGRCLWHLAYINLKLERLEKAESLYAQAYSIYKRTYGADHADCANILEDLSVCGRLRGNPNLALKQSYDAFFLKSKQLQNNIIILTERDAIAYAKKMRKSADNYFSCWLDAGE